MNGEKLNNHKPGRYSEGTSRAGAVLTIQRKLTVGSVDDPLEEEADTMADHVMRMPETPIVQRKCIECKDKEEGDRILRKPMADSIKRFSESKSDRGSYASEPVTSQIHASRGKGSPLPYDTRTFMESRFGSDFSGIRVHAGDEAAQMSKEMNAQAFTLGKDIYFNSDKYTPGSSEGRHLLAHELTHTIQQESTNEIFRKLEVNPGLKLDTKGFTTSRSGDIYTCPKVTKSSVWNEIFSALLNTSRVFKIKGTTDAEVDENLEKHMVARKGIIDFALKKKYEFGAGAASRVNKKYWDSALKLKPGVNQQAALDDLNINPKEYAIACLAATTMTVVGGAKSNYDISFTSDEDDWIPGDWGYIKNNKFSGLNKDIGLEGENIIYVGKDKFWGHFTGTNTYRTFQEWFDEVESWNGEAETLVQRKYPLMGLE